ncbi:MAG: DNA-3-methyladenine glycosylase [Clostridia bacterium]|nr:DNA-3-methyladenine glycosylase [Clostridia bacterium]
MRIENCFYEQNADVAAPKLVGKLICYRKADGEVLRMRITETECYLGESDTACHASKGKTERNSALWLPGGFSYVYLCYGMYNMFNVITGIEGEPQGVLIRGVEGYQGPGKFTKFAGIDRSCNRIDMRVSDMLWIEDDGFAPELRLSARVGIDYAEQRDRERLWRFIDTRYVKK